MDIARTIGQFTGDRFQDLVSRLLAASVSDFQAVNGAGGDSGNDGYSRGMAAVFQVYGPEKTDASRLRRKIEDSVEKAVRLRGGALPELKRFVFVTPFDLTHEQHLYLQRLATTADLVSESWGLSRLTGLVAQYPEVARTFPEFQVLEIAKALRPDAAHIRKHVADMFGEAVIDGLVKDVEALEGGVRKWLDPSQTDFVRRNLKALIWNEKGALGDQVGWLAEDNGARASGAVKTLLEHLDLMVSTDEGHDRETPQNVREELAARLFELTGQAKKELEERLHAFDSTWPG